VNDESRALAHFIATTAHGDVPGLVRANALATIVDAYGTALAGVGETGPRTTVNALLPLAGQGASRALGVPGRRVDPASAALFNASAAHALDYDAISFAVSGFVGSQALFALAALADEGRYSGREVVTAYCVGWEAAAALGRALNPGHYAKGWHPTATLGTFSAAAAASRLLGLTTDQTVAALAVATSEASGVKTMIGNMVNAWHVGKAARNGVNAALLARGGFTGHMSPLEWDQGFLALFAGPSGARPDRMLKGLGERWDLAEPGPVFKIHACCGLIHSGLDAVAALRQSEQLSVDDVLEVRVRVHEYVPRVMQVEHPSSGYAAKFCVPYCVAAALRDGRAGLSAFDGVDPELVEIGRRVRVEVHPDLVGGDSFFEKEFTEVEIRTTRGTVEHRVDRLTNRGTGSLDRDGLVEKFSECATYGVGGPADRAGAVDGLLVSEHEEQWSLWRA
jgi:2-methylcitrate dehydratase PrpD